MKTHSKRYFVCCLLFYVLTSSNAQVFKDTMVLKTRLIFGKLYGPFFAREFRPDLYGRAYYSYAANAFIESSQLRNSQGAYKRCGFMYYKFERYCRDNKIQLNRRELKRYRRSAVLSGFFFSMATVHPTLFVLDAWDYSMRTGYYKMPQVYFKSERAPYLRSAYILEWAAAYLIKNRAQKRLRDRVFKPDAIAMKNL